MNLTLQIDDDVLARARLRALRQGTSVNALVRTYLESFAGEDRQMGARRRFLERAAEMSGDYGYSGRNWTRDDLHDRGA